MPYSTNVIVPQPWVDVVGPLLASNADRGRVLAEQLYRDDTMRPVFQLIMRGEPPANAQRAELPPLARGSWDDVLAHFHAVREG